MSQVDDRMRNVCVRESLEYIRGPAALACRSDPFPFLRNLSGKQPEYLCGNDACIHERGFRAEAEGGMSRSYCTFQIYGTGMCVLFIYFLCPFVGFLQPHVGFSYGRG